MISNFPKDLIFAQIESELHALTACISLTELVVRERAVVHFLEGIPQGCGGAHRYIRVLLKSHIRFMKETQGLDATEEVLRVTQTAASLLRDEISPGMGVVQILEERGEPRGPARTADRRPSGGGPWDLEDEED
jgi:hypothetical protein